MLPTRRLLNLVYHWGTRNAGAEQRAEMDEALEVAGRMDLTAMPEAPREHIPGTAPSFRKPSWWKGDRAAFKNSVAAGRELGKPAAITADVPGVPRRAAPSIGSRRPAGVV